MTRALVVSADDVLRTALQVTLGAPGGIADQVDGLAVASEATSVATAYDLVVLDSGQADLPAAEWCAAVTERGFVPILVLADDADVELLTACLAAGAAGFQTKAVGLDELSASLAAVHRGEAVVPRRMLGALLGSLIERRRRDDAASARFDRLTRRERETLQLIAQGHDRAEVADRLVISPETARTHIQNVLTKLEVHSRIDAARFAHDHGFADPSTGGQP